MTRSGGLALLGGLGLLLAACGSSDVPEGSGDLSQACQLKPCYCAETGGSIFNPKSADILWRDNGDAYCPEGFHLEEGEPPE